MADPVRHLRDGSVIMLEDPTTPTFLSLTATEWHAFGFGLKEGLWFWKRTPLAWDEIKKMEALPDNEKPMSPELISALKDKYHYYIVGFALPEDCALLCTGMYLMMTNAPGLVNVGLSVFGYSR
ncbi:MAG: hypothetical protein NTW33_01860 [Methanoregula sp.]|nr:hypothetical protein [Methanoregula sp.]